MAINITPVIGVFDDSTTADRAIQALMDAGFDNSQVSYSGHASGGGFFSGLKSLFTGEDETATSVVHDLTNMGLSEDQANYYADEHTSGHPVIAVRAAGREQEARTILNSAGGYDHGRATRSGSSIDTVAGTATSSTTTGYSQLGGYGEQSRMTGRDADVGGNSAAYSDRTGNSDRITMNRSGYANSDDINKALRPDMVTDSTANQPGYANRTDTDTTMTDATMQGNRTANSDRINPADMTSDAQRSLRLREEQLQTNKQTVQAGEVRLGKDIIEEQKSINVPVTHEEVVIERRPGSGNISTDTTPIGQDETVRIPLSQEQVNVTKTAVETGEITVGKRAVTENQTFINTVRHEEVRVDNDGNVPIIDNVSGEPEVDDNVRNRNTNRNSRKRNRPQQ